MNPSLRNLHRWTAILFTLSVVVTSAALAAGNAPDWVNYLPLPFLFILLATGLYMLGTHYWRRMRSKA